MKHFIAMAVLALVPTTAAVSCTTAQLANTEEDRALVLSLEEQLASAEASLAAAIAAGDAELTAAAQATIDSLSLELTNLEEREATERVGGVVSFVGALPVIGPYVAPLSPLLLGLAPLLGRRGRKHAKTLVRNLNPFDGNGGSWGDSLATLGKYLGMSHSSPASEEASNA